ncbi:MAG: DUF58 domain-containing protein [Planctomycetaceae bacterium]|nr:MAG: DUF58 domain-containing protein [Planctomycetaceae bacterium]
MGDANGWQNRVNASISLTRLGWQFLFIGLFAMIGGVIRAYNLPLALAGLIIAATLLHWRWSRHTVRSLALTRDLPEEAYAGRPFLVRFRVTNRSKWLPAWLIRIDDSVVGSEAEQPRSGGRVARLVAWAVGTRIPLMERLLGSVSNRRPRGGGRGWRPNRSWVGSGIGMIPPGGTLATSYRCVVSCRGRYDFGPASVSSGSPLGLLIYWRRVPLVSSLWVFPECLPLRPEWRERLSSRGGGDALSARRSGGVDGEFFGIRGWRAGDSRRWIHWRTTARIGEPAVRQFEQDRRLQFCILLDAFVPDPGRLPEEPLEGLAKRDAEAALETVIRVAASIVTQLSGVSGNRIGLVLAGDRTTPMVTVGGREQTIGILRALAELAGHPNPDLEEAIRQAHHQLGKPRAWLVLSPRRQSDLRKVAFAGLFVDGVCTWLSTADGSLDGLLEGSSWGPVAVSGGSSGDASPAGPSQVVAERTATDREVRVVG